MAAGCRKRDEIRCRWVEGDGGEDCDVRVRVSCIITRSETIFQANDVLCLFGA